MTSERRALGGLALTAMGAVSLLTVMLYWPALSGPLLLDDSTVVAPLLRAAQLGHDWRSFLFSDSGPLGRPLAMASFIANAHWSLDLRYWKATNLAVHVLNGWLVYALFANLARAAGKRADRVALLALGGAALWLLHPLNISTVMYLCQRMTELATLFGLLAMLLYTRGRMASVDRRGARLAIASAFFVCTPLAALAKEIGLLTPFYLLAIEICFFAGPRWPRPVWLRVLLTSCTLLPLCVAGVYLSSHWQTQFAGPYSLRDFNPIERLLTEARALVAYLVWIVAPRRAVLGFYHDDFVVAHWPPDGLTMLAIASLCALASAAWHWRQRAPLAAFGVMLFLLGHALESSVFALELVFEHRNYLPAIGICLTLAAAIVQWLDTRRAVLLLGALVLPYALVTASMTPTWGNEGALYSAFYIDHPNSRRARAELIEWLLARGDVEAAEHALGDALDVSAQLHRLRIGCMRDHRAANDDAALSAAAAMARPDDMSVEILLWLVNQVQDGACALDSARLAATIEAIRDRPLPTNSRFLLYVSDAQLRHARGEHVEAGRAAATAAELMPDDPYPVYLGVEIALDAGDLHAARSLLSAARERARRQHEDFSRMDAGLAAALDAR